MSAGREEVVEGFHSVARPDHGRFTSSHLQRANCQLRIVWIVLDEQDDFDGHGPRVYLATIALPRRQREEKRGTFARRRFAPNAPSVPMNDPVDNGEADP